MSGTEAAAAGPSSSDLILHSHPDIPRCSGPLLVCVLDGWGVSKYDDEYNATFVASTPCMDSLKAQGSRQDRYRLLKAHGTAVGLPSDADMGNSEVGHNALGSGQIVDQGAKCVDKALSTGSLFDNPEGWGYIQEAAISGTLHLLGLLSDGGVHSRYDQIMLLIRGAIQRGVTRLRLHVLSDGRDVEDGTAVMWLEKLTADLQSLMDENPGVDARIASGGGRMRTTMDRYESDWKVVKAGWDAAILGQAPNKLTDPIAGVRELQTKGGVFVSDQWIEPWVVVEKESGAAVGAVQDGDALVTFNFRADRMIEISQALEYPREKFEDLMEEGKYFDRQRFPKIKFAGMMQYDNEIKLPSHHLVPPPAIERASEQFLMNSTPETRVFACSESQKIGHVTFFWNGNRSGYLDPSKEKFVEIPSDQGISFDQAPAMKASEIAAVTVDAITSGKYDFVRCNFANPDMVGHTGNLKACVEACGVVDKCISDLIEAVDEMGGRWLITADHGNAEEMVDRDKKTGEPLMGKNGKMVPLTSHTLNPVPCIIGGTGMPDNVKFKRRGLEHAGLANVTATFLNLLGYEAPEFYEKSLLEVVKKEQ